MNEYPPPPASGQPERQRAFNVPPVTLWSMAALLLVYLVLNVAPAPWTDFIVVHGSLIPPRVLAALENPWAPSAWLAFATLLTHAFIHLDFMHFALNAGFLLAFGSAIERALGSRRAALLLALSAVAGGIAQIWAEGAILTIMFGASGAVAGAMGAMAVLLAFDGNAASRRTGWAIAGVLVAMNLAIAAFGSGFAGLSGEIAWQAHLGGFAAGALLAFGFRAWR